MSDPLEKSEVLSEAGFQFVGGFAQFPDDAVYRALVNRVSTTLAAEARLISNENLSSLTTHKIKWECCSSLLLLGGSEPATNAFHHAAIDWSRRLISERNATVCDFVTGDGLTL